ncbi:hypothetical protein GQ607_013709 [Colletotrichum asianum]|uniref:Secreted protein n=1 Tax=Colletotrichum asianum TaxID=702518 RepID=A0A8H3ZH59_9PEZI|nr:hypothetical protein GQ607_013709 [Colletotrichum asianum]
MIVKLALVGVFACRCPGLVANPFDPLLALLSKTRLPSAAWWRPRASHAFSAMREARETRRREGLVSAPISRRRRVYFALSFLHPLFFAPPPDAYDGH